MTAGQHATFAFMVFLNASVLPSERLIFVLLHYHLRRRMAESRIEELVEVSSYVLSQVSLLVTFLVSAIQAVSIAVDTQSNPLTLSVVLIFALLLVPALALGVRQNPLAFRKRSLLGFLSSQHVYSLIGAGLSGLIWLLASTLS